MRIRRPLRAAVYVAVIALAVGYVVFSAIQQRNTARHSQLAPFTSIPVVLTDGKWMPADSSERGSAPIEDGSVMSIHQSEYQRGLWHAVIAEQELFVRCEDCLRGSPLPEQAIAGVLSQVHDAQPHLLRADLLEARSTGAPIRRILWLGVLGDVSILAAIAAIIFSVVKLWREIRWRKPGCCTECDYDLAGLKVEKCSECGSVVEGKADAGTG